MAAPAPTGSRAEKTRASILEAAEHLFAEHGFAATRLEDIAVRVGIRRASMVYHFKDKRELYGAVIEQLLEGLHTALDGATAKPLAPQPRIEAAIGAWVDFLGGRPTAARILMREVASAGRNLRPELATAAKPIRKLMRSRFISDEAVRSTVRELNATRVDPMHVASAVAGSTLFFVVASPLVAVGRPDFNPLDAEHMAGHKEEVLRAARRLLNFDDPEPA